MTQNIIFLQKKNNLKSRRRIRKIEFLARKDAQRALNQALKKAFWRHENPRQQLIDFHQQIAVYTHLFTQSRKKQKKQRLIKQKAQIEVRLYH